MPSSKYKEPRQCACGYTTIDTSNWSKHKKACALIPNEKDARIASLENDKEQLTSQLAAKDVQLAVQDAEIAGKDALIELLQKLVPASKRPKGSQKRKSFTEPFRRKIAIRQDWKCANPDGECIKLDLEEYDVDHIIPLHQGGTNRQDNLQAICPACHRRKTEREACMQVEASGSEATDQEGVVVQ